MRARRRDRSGKLRDRRHRKEAGGVVEAEEVEEGEEEEGEEEAEGGDGEGDITMQTSS